MINQVNESLQVYQVPVTDLLSDTALVKVLKPLDLTKYNNRTVIHNMDLTNVGIFSVSELDYDQRAKIRKYCQNKTIDVHRE